MSQNQLITLLSIVLLLVIGGSVLVLIQSTPPSQSPVSTDSAPLIGDTTNTVTYNIDVLQQQAYQLLNKQLVKEGALPVQPAAASGKANPFL